MSDASNEDARPLTKEERDMLIDCLFGLSQSLFTLSQMNAEALVSIERHIGKTVIDRKLGAEFIEDMRVVTSNILKLGLKLGVLKDG